MYVAIKVLISLFPGKWWFPYFQVNDDFLDDILSQPGEGVDASLLQLQGEGEDGLDHLLVKDEPLGEDDLRALQRDRIKKDNHNMSKFS